MELWLSGNIPTKAILMVSHNIEEAVFMADRLIIMDKNPGHILTEVVNTLPHPRRRKEKAFLALVDQIYSQMLGKTQPEPIELGSAPGEAGPTRALPHSQINAISGLLERVNEEVNNKIDVYRLADEFVDSYDEIIPIIEATEMLGFAFVDAGDLTLTPLGQTFAEGSIQTRKEIFAARIRRVPMIRWILQMLNAQPEKRLSWDVFVTALGREFPMDEAEKQLDTAVNWARYAELFSYDNSDNTIFLEVPEVATSSGA